MTVRCARCQRRLKDRDWIYSPWSRNHYCTDIDACRRRVEKTEVSKRGPRPSRRPPSPALDRGAGDTAAGATPCLPQHNIKEEAA